MGPPRDFSLASMPFKRGCVIGVPGMVAEMCCMFLCCTATAEAATVVCRHAQDTHVQHPEGAQLM